MTSGRTRRPLDARSAAEAAFKAITDKQAPLPAPPSVLPGAREQVSLRLDQDVLNHFRATGPGWQERINSALRKVMET